MRILFLTGIWPPDIGGPASHGPDFARFLGERGHQVRVVTMGDGEPSERPCPIEVVDRGRPFPVRYSEVAVRGIRAARHADAIYATATYAAAAAAASVGRRPLVAKLVTDPAYERAYRYGLFRGTLEEFQSAPGGRLAALKHGRNAALRVARSLVVPSRYLASFADEWGLGRRITVVSNPMPETGAVEPAMLEPGTIVFVGRLVRQKRVEIVLEALSRMSSGRLLVVGDGPVRHDLEQRASELALDGRVSFLGSLPRRDVLALLAGGDLAVLSSDWENLPHAVVEALSLGTPVVATAVGGVPEVVHDGVNGLLVPPSDAVAMANALDRVLSDASLRGRLAACARPSVEHISRSAVYGKLEDILLEAADTSL